jgi:hypothetical protein
MRHLNRLTEQQRTFLRALRTEPATLEELVRRYRVRPWVMSRWFRHPVFRDALAGVMREVRLQGSVELQLADRKAKRVLADMVNGTVTTGQLQRQACYDVIDLHHHRPKRRGPAKQKRAPLPPPERAPTPHPSHSPARAAQLVEELRALQANPTPDEEPDAPAAAADAPLEAT